MSFHYWWTRVSTVGISSSSVVLLALGYSLGGTVEAIDQSDALWQYMVFVPMFLISPLLMLRCITRIEFGWNKWHPTLTRASANHRERTTQRVDSRTSWGTRLAVRCNLSNSGLLTDYDLHSSSLLFLPHTSFSTLTTLSWWQAPCLIRDQGNSRKRKL